MPLVLCGLQLIVMFRNGHEMTLSGDAAFSRGRSSFDDLLRDYRNSVFRVQLLFGGSNKRARVGAAYEPRVHDARNYALPSGARQNFHRVPNCAFGQSIIDNSG